MEVNWRDWPAQRQRGRAGLAGGIIVLASVSVAVIDPLLAAICTIAMVAAVSEVLLPTTYRLSGEGVAVDTVLSKRAHPWRHFKAWQVLPTGVALQGDGPGRLIRRRRSLLLRCPDNAEAVQEALRHWMPERDA